MHSTSRCVCMCIWKWEFQVSVRKGKILGPNTPARFISTRMYIGEWESEFVWQFLLISLLRSRTNYTKFCFKKGLFRFGALYAHHRSQLESLQVMCIILTPFLCFTSKQRIYLHFCSRRKILKWKKIVKSFQFHGENPEHFHFNTYYYQSLQNLFSRKK